MKNLYIIMLSSFCTLLASTASAQCLCSGGLTPQTVEHRYTLAANSSPSISIPFPKFDPALGTLACLVYNDTLSNVSTTRVRNYDSADQQYTFRLTVNNTITAPTLSLNAYMDRYYGPDSLKAYNKGLDSIKYGPDTTFKNITHAITKTTGLAAYMGTGNVYFSYNVSGGLISMEGGLNFSQQIETARWGSFKITYFWCPNSVLASNINNFIVNKKGQGVMLAWTTINQFNSYEIEISTDGKSFSSAGKADQPTVAGSASAKYEYQYNPDQVVTGTVYFRIKETDPDGKISYSETKMITLNAATVINIYPNPAIDGVNIKLAEYMQGKVEVSLVNTTGQTLFHKTYLLDKLNSINVQWPAPLKRGVYFLKLRDSQAQTESISKIFIK